jgi:hypothetical protein
MTLFKKKPKTQERSLFIEPPKVHISISRKFNVGNYESIDLNAGLSSMVGDTITVLKRVDNKELVPVEVEGSNKIPTIQEARPLANETIEDAFKRVFDAVREELEREIKQIGLPRTIFK